MARPQKVGIDYFALDVKMDDEVSIIEAEYGLEGFAVLIKLFQKIYSEGYFYTWEDKEKILFGSRVNVDRNLLTSIVNDCIKWDIFDSNLYEKYNILTSKRIQNHYFTSTYKRVDVEAIEEYLLINVTDRKNVSMTRVSDDGNEDTSIVVDVQSTQSKVKESKVNKSIVYEREEEPKVNPKNTSSLIDKNKEDFKAIANLYQQVIGQANGLTANWINDSLEIYGFEWLKNAMMEAEKRGKRSKKYVEAILSNWKTEGGMRLESNNKKTYTKPRSNKTRFHNFEQRSDKYSDGDLEKITERKRQEARKGAKNIGSSLGIDLGGYVDGD